MNPATPFAMRATGSRFVYILRSESDPSRHYVGRTSDVENRVGWHNAGPCGHTIQHRPWFPVVVVEFRDESTAARFEKYLKSAWGARSPGDTLLQKAVRGSDLISTKLPVVTPCNGGNACGEPCLLLR